MIEAIMMKDGTIQLLNEDKTHKASDKASEKADCASEEADRVSEDTGLASKETRIERWRGRRQKGEEEKEGAKTPSFHGGR